MVNLGNFPRVRFVLILLFMHFLIFSMSCLPVWGQWLPTAKFPAQDPAAAQKQTDPEIFTPPTYKKKAIIPKMKVPPLTGLSPKQAAGKLESSGLKLGNVTPAPAQRQAGTIFRQDPGPPAEVLPQTKVDVWVAQAQVPKLFGLKEPQARQALVNAGLVLQTAGRTLSPRPIDTIVNQKPSPGVWLNAGSQVQVWIAQDGQVQVPELQHRSLNEAQQRLRPLNLQLVEAGSKPSKAAAGTIVEQYPQPENWVPVHSQVKVWVSPGPPPPVWVKVPDLIGMSEEEAKQAVKSAKLVVRQIKRLSDHPSRKVIHQKPGKGEEKEPESPVDFTLGYEEPPPPPPDPSPSKIDPKRHDPSPPLPSPVEVPDLRGKGLQEAQNTLSAKELRLAKAGDSCSLSPAGTVVRQSPAPHSPARKGSAVQVWVAAGLFSPGCWPWPAGGGAVAALLIWLLYRLARLSRGGPEHEPPHPPRMEARVAPDDRSKQEVVFEGQNLPALELRLRFTADPGTQDLETTGPLIKGERKEHE